MDTVYYRLNTRKVKVSGGADLVTFVPAPVTEKAGQVLDFDLCRRKLETKNAWKDLARTAQTVRPAASASEDFAAVETDDVEVPAPRRRRRAGASDVLEVLCSAAVLLVSLCAAGTFLALL